MQSIHSVDKRDYLQTSAENISADFCVQYSLAATIMTPGIHCWSLYKNQGKCNNINVNTFTSVNRLPPPFSSYKPQRTHALVPFLCQIDADAASGHAAKRQCFCNGPFTSSQSNSTELNWTGSERASTNTDTVLYSACRIFGHRRDYHSYCTQRNTLFASAKEVMFSSLFVCLSVSNFAQKLLNGFAWNFQESLTMDKWTND